MNHFNAGPFPSLPGLRSSDLSESETKHPPQVQVQGQSSADVSYVAWKSLHKSLHFLQGFEGAAADSAPGDSRRILGRPRLRHSAPCAGDPEGLGACGPRGRGRAAEPADAAVLDGVESSVWKVADHIEVQRHDVEARSCYGLLRVVSGPRPFAEANKAKLGDSSEPAAQRLGDEQTALGAPALCCALIGSVASWPKPRVVPRHGMQGRPWALCVRCCPQELQTLKASRKCSAPLRRYAVLRSLRAADCEDQSERALEASKKSSHRTEERSMERGASFRA